MAAATSFGNGSARGGMGEVWRAEDTILRRPVALKVLHPALSDDEGFQRRFVEEARTVAALRARGVVEIFDIRAERDEHGEAMTYLVMQFLEGQSLHTVIERHAPMPAQRVLPLLAQIADALEVAHQAGIVHRDIKPANIIVDAKRVPTILDFGIALRRDQTALTATGTVLGTVGYASPEQLRGEDLTGASDLYSLGVIAYECLSGAIPFDRNSPAAVITGHLHEAPPPLPPGVPPVAAELVDWAMAKDPADRPASAGMFAQECRVAVQQTKPAPAESNRTTVDLLVSSSPPVRPTAPMPAAPEPERPRRRRGRGVLWGLAAVIAAVALTIGTMRLFDEDEPGGQGASEDPTAEGGAPEATEPATADEATSEAVSEEEAPPLPGTSVLVSAATGDCLVGYHDTPPPSAQMGLCDDNGIDEFAFVTEGDEVSIAHSYEYDNWPNGSETITECIWWDEEHLNLAERCGETTWQFTYLRTDEAEDADFWQVRASGDGNYCLTVADPAPTLSPCTADDVNQQWRTTAG
ncbi:protein kinase [Glycomyces luteolus]|uniref:non-specific serine/threonine protein kinase n=1 Tax=Glycomyces luteolus TaxID=2670330 RepID=A0A9X3PMA7_9ACTN|nr:serine/threonine-protein kinase [Glycomyces luteolus]MDA1361295.1 protein kinase [Glycomyces luteolus]